MSATDPLHQFIVAPNAAVVPLWDDRFAIEANVMAAALANPARGIVDAEAAGGLTAADFSDPVYAAVWRALDECRRLGRLTGDRWGDVERVLWLAKDSMVTAGVWHDGLPGHLGDRADEYPNYNPLWLADYARGLRESADELTFLGLVLRLATAVLGRGWAAVLSQAPDLPRLLPILAAVVDRLDGGVEGLGPAAAAPCLCVGTSKDEREVA